MEKNRRWLNYLSKKENLTSVGRAVLIGLLGGVGVWLFKLLINLFNLLAFGEVEKLLAPLGGWSVAILPVLGGIGVGLIAYYLIGAERLHGTAAIMESTAWNGNEKEPGNIFQFFHPVFLRLLPHDKLRFVY